MARELRNKKPKASFVEAELPKRVPRAKKALAQKLHPKNASIDPVVSPPNAAMIRLADITWQRQQLQPLLQESLALEVAKTECLKWPTADAPESQAARTSHDATLEKYNGVYRTVTSSSKFSAEHANPAI